MKFLVMGGTLFLGRAIVEVALNAGHQITVFNRGQTNPDLFPEIEHLIGDRNSDLRALSGRSFDALIDTSAYFPRQVASVVDALAGQIEHYSFVSSMSVYAQSDEPNADESAGLGTVTDPKDEHSDENYGGFKALCEHALDSALPGRAHHVRAGLIVGPHDNTGRFSYWVQRFVSGGDVLAPQPPDQPIQLIDVRDLAEWTVHAATTGVTGPINASGAPGTHTMASMLATIQTSTASQATVHWVDEDFLMQRKVRPWSDLPLWLPPRSLPTHAGFMARDTSKAVRLGLTIRPLADTISATIDAGIVGGGGLSSERESELLQEWSAVRG
jgi:2'-hydroxyisoflavone reductase